MLPSVIVALIIWIMATAMVTAACQAASRGDAALAKAARKASESSHVTTFASLRLRGGEDAASVREREIGRPLWRAACRHGRVTTLQRLQTGATRHLARGAVTVPSVKCPARGNRWGHVRGIQRDRSPLAPQHTVTRAGACGQDRHEQ
jgi:hypothetical protein